MNIVHQLPGVDPCGDGMEIRGPLIGIYDTSLPVPSNSKTFKIQNSQGIDLGVDILSVI